MSENCFGITKLNDFIFCPASIYFHELDSDTDKLTYQDSYQLNGTAAHSKTDCGQYSDKLSVKQNMSVYSERYNLYGKIDVFDTESGLLTERKKHIAKIYDGYIFQLYAQYFALKEMGYQVSKLRLYSYDDNKSYYVLPPEENTYMFNKFEDVINQINNFDFSDFHQDNPQKCCHCIYEPLCSYSCKGDSNVV